MLLKISFDQNLAKLKFETNKENDIDKEFSTNNKVLNLQIHRDSYKNCIKLEGCRIDFRSIPTFFCLFTANNLFTVD